MRVKSTYRTFVRFDTYEMKMLRRLQREFSKAEGRQVSMNSVIRGCVHWAIRKASGEEPTSITIPKGSPGQPGKAN